MDGEKIKRKYTSGKLEKDCETKEERRMGFKKHFLVWNWKQRVFGDPLWFLDFGMKWCIRSI
jgi:hypothetical protein